MKTREDKRMVQLEIFSRLAFLGIFGKKPNTFALGHGHSSWSTFTVHLVRGPKALQIDFLKKVDHGLWCVLYL